MKTIIKILFELFLIIIISCIITMIFFSKVPLQRNLIIYFKEIKDLDLQKIKEYYLLNNAKLIDIELKGNRLKIKYEADKDIFPKTGSSKIKEAISFFSIAFDFKSFVFLIPLHILFLLLGGYKFLKMEKKYRIKKSNLIKGIMIFPAMLIFGYFYGIFIEKFFKIQFNAFEYIFKDINLLGIIFIILLAPIAEEIYFRGYIFNTLLKNNGIIFSIIYTSIIFALLHLNVSLFLYYFIIGCFLAYAYKISETIILPILMHSVYNFFVIINGI